MSTKSYRDEDFMTEEEATTSDLESNLNQLHSQAKKSIYTDDDFISEEEAAQIETKKAQSAEAIQPKMGKMEAALVSGVRGATFGLADEGVGAITGLAEVLKGGTFKEGFSKGAERVRAKQNKADIDQPGTALVSDIAGSVAAPIGLIGSAVKLSAKGAQMAAKLATKSKPIQALIKGGATGGLEGFARQDGDLAERTVAGVSGSITGGALSGIGARLLRGKTATIKEVTDELDTATKAALQLDPDTRKRIIQSSMKAGNKAADIKPQELAEFALKNNIIQKGDDFKSIRFRAMDNITKGSDEIGEVLTSKQAKQVSPNIVDDLWFSSQTAVREPSQGKSLIKPASDYVEKKLMFIKDNPSTEGLLSDLTNVKKDLRTKAIKSTDSNINKYYNDMADLVDNRIYSELNKIDPNLAKKLKDGNNKMHYGMLIEGIAEKANNNLPKGLPQVVKAGLLSFSNNILLAAGVGTVLDSQARAALQKKAANDVVRLNGLLAKLEVSDKQAAAKTRQYFNTLIEQLGGLPSKAADIGLQSQNAPTGPRGEK